MSGLKRQIFYESRTGNMQWRKTYPTTVYGFSSRNRTHACAFPETTLITVTKHAEALIPLQLDKVQV